MQELVVLLSQASFSQYDFCFEQAIEQIKHVPFEARTDTTVATIRSICRSDREQVRYLINCIRSLLLGMGNTVSTSESVCRHGHDADSLLVDSRSCRALPIVMTCQLQPEIYRLIKHV